MKYILIIVLIFIATFAGADTPSWLEVEWAFQLGWIPNGNVNFYQPNKSIDLCEPFDTIFKIDAKLFDFILIGGKCINMFSNKGEPDVSCPINFLPTGMNYIFNFGIEPIKGISINYEHSCFHPVMPYLPLRPGNPILDGFYDRIYFEIKGKLIF